MARFVEVAVDFKSEPAKTFTFVVPDELQPVSVGSLVRVPFRTRELNGIVFEVSDIPAYAEPLEIIKVLSSEVLLTRIQVNLATWMSKYYLCSLYEAASLMLPVGQKHIGKIYVDFDKSFKTGNTYLKEHINLEKDSELFTYLFQEAPLELNQVIKTFGFTVEKKINSLVREGILVFSYGKKGQIPKPKFIEYVYVPFEDIKLIPLQIKKFGKRGNKQKAVLKKLAIVSIPLSESYSQFGRYAVNKLLNEKLVKKQKIMVERNPLANIQINKLRDNLVLTEYQNSAISEIDSSLKNYRFEDSLFLVHGVTGSGKTEVYAQAVKKCLDLGKKAIIIVPEISLTRQTIEYFGSRFPGIITVLHSYLTLGQRFDQWWRIAKGKYSVVIGSRSALFAPVKNLGLIIIDEEHEWTYKQIDSNPRYNAKDVAVKLAEMSKSVMILGSATPECTTYHRALAGKIKLLKLPYRVSGITRTSSSATGKEATVDGMPEIEIVDMKRELISGNRSIFSRKLLGYLSNSFEQGSQVILFINRRGSFSSMQCRECGSVATCGRCSLPFTYHAEIDKLICHRCAQRRRFFLKCLKCGNDDVYYRGIGTQQVVANINKHFPDISAIRWDSDTAKNIKEHERILEEFRSNSAQVLVGTQMIAKGLHFPNVTLVGVVLADLGLYAPDFRAGERTFQILSQVSGRSGRGSVKGKVLIQTYSPSNYAINDAAKQDYELFYEKEIRYRKQQSAPPYSRLIKLLYSNTDMNKCINAGKKLAELLRFERYAVGDVTNEVFGPTPAYPSRLRGKYRWQVVLRGNEPKRLLNNLRIPNGWIVDVDPVN